MPATEAERSDVAREHTLASLEGLRFLSSAAILTYHYTWFVASPPPPVIDQLRLCVDLFFVISGIVIGLTYRGRIGDFVAYAVFIQRRIARLYPLHLATLLFYCGVSAAFAYGWVKVPDPERYSFDQLVPNLLLTHAWGAGKASFNFVSWSISAEFFAYLTFPLTLWLVGDGRRRRLWWVAGLLLMAIAGSHLLLHRGLDFLDWKFGILRVLPSFALGVWLSAYGPRIADRVPALAAKAGAGLAAAVFAVFVLSDAHHLLTLISIYGLVATLFLCDVKSIRTFASWRPISALGPLTYSIYMLHPVFATLLISALFPRIFGHSLAAVVASIVCATAATFAASQLSYHYFEQPLRRAINAIPIHSWLRPAWRTRKNA